MSVVVEQVNSPDDFPQIFHCISAAFGRQIKDTIWMTMNTNWDSPTGQVQGAARLLHSWQSVTHNAAGQPNAVFLKATLHDPTNPSQRRIVGAAIWSQTSFVPGQGDPPTSSPAALETLPPTERRFATQMYRSLWRRRVEIAREKGHTDSPAIFTLDCCAVDPEFQRRGIAGKLVAWGLEEAERRGGLECTTEASPMGRVVYGRLGFGAEGSGEDLVYVVDDEFKDRDKPEILFMRTWADRAVAPL